MKRAVVIPDLSARPFRLSVERKMTSSPGALLRGWTEEFDRWFAVAGSVLMKGEVNASSTSKQISKDRGIRITVGFLG